jgi:hypothetical protein
MPCPTLSLWLDDYIYVWRRVNIMKRLIMQFPPTSYYLIHFLPKYSLQHSLPKYFQPVVSHAPGVIFAWLPLYAVLSLIAFTLLYYVL